MTQKTSPSVRETISAILEIENYSTINFVFKETRFTSTDNKFDFGFGLFPKNELSFVSHQVLTYLYFYKCPSGTNLRYTISILIDKDVKSYTKEYYWNFDSSENITQHISNFILRSYLLEPENGFVMNDKLRLLCEVDILDTETDSEMFQMSHDFGTLLESEKHSDVILVVGEKNFNVHKLILSARSPVFAAMFDHSETKEAQEGRVEISDMSLEACEQMLRFIYTEQVEQLDLYGLELLAAADKYQLESLKSVCEQYLSSTLDYDNVSTILQLASRHNALNLKVKCIEYITSNHVTEVMDTDGWRALIEAGEIDLVAELLKDLALKTNR